MTSEIDYPRLPFAGVISTSEEAGDYAREFPHLYWQPRLGGWLAEHEGEIRQLIGGINGFKAYYLLKTGDGTTTISVFDDRAGAEESNRAAAAWIAENLPDLNIAPPNVTPGEAVVNFESQQTPRARTAC